MNYFKKTKLFYHFKNCCTTITEGTTPILVGLQHYCYVYHVMSVILCTELFEAPQARF